MADLLGGRRRIVQDHRRGDHHVELSVPKRQPLTSAEQHRDPVQPIEEPARVLELRRTEVKPDQGHIESPPQRPEQLAVAAADFQDRCGTIRGQALGHPLGSQRASSLAFLFAEVVFTASQGPVKPRIGIEPAPLPGWPAAQCPSQRLVPGVPGTAIAHGIPGPDRECRMRRNHQFHEHRPWSLGATHSQCAPGRFLRTLRHP